MIVENGNTVTVDYIGTLNDGSVFDTSLEAVAKQAKIFNPQRPYEAISFVVGK
jgi:FKBP-type peptidyl-prolyl cis-trans isomerase 2